MSLRGKVANSSVIALCLIGCGGPLTGLSDDVPSPSPVDTGVFEGPWVTTTDHGDGTFTTRVVASSLVDWVWFSFSDPFAPAGVAVSPAEPAETWHLAFQREHILIDGGISGDGPIEAAELADIPFAAVQHAPVAGFAVDAPDDDDDGEDQEVLYTWFEYDFDNHVLVPTDHTFVVRTPAGDVRMWVETYYLEPESAQGSGYPLFHWAWLTEPGPLVSDTEGLRVDATDAPAWVHLREQIAVTPPDPAASPAWDVAFEGDTVALNGGVSGTGGRAAAFVEAAFDEVSVRPPAEAFGTDAEDADEDGVPEYALASAWEGDPPTPREGTWVISRPDGTAAKLGLLEASQGDGPVGAVRFRTQELPALP